MLASICSGRVVLVLTFLRGRWVHPRALVVKLVFQRLAKRRLRGNDRRRREVVLRAVGVGAGEVGLFFGMDAANGKQRQEVAGFHGRFPQGLAMSR